jgi:hypothetical protein
MPAPNTFDILKRFDELPDDALVSSTVAAIVLNTGERTVRRNFPRVQTSARRFGFRVGTLRSLIRGQPLSAA